MSLSAIVVLALLLIFSGYSYYGMQRGYETYTGRFISSPSRHDKPDYAFEYPRGYYHPFRFDHMYLYHVSDVVLRRDRLGWFTTNKSSIHIRVWDASFFEPVRQLSLAEKNMAYVYPPDELYRDRPLTELGDLDVPKDFTVDSTYVDGIPAYLITFTILMESDLFASLPIRMAVRAVTFEHGDYIWVISIFYPERGTVPPDPGFEHLIQTFRVLPHSR